MNALNCQEVEERLDLLAAGECDRPTRLSVEDHLQSCPTCTASYQESQRVLGWLNVHYSEAGQVRLRRRIEQEQPRGQGRLFLPYMRRAVALAAMVLLTAGLLWLRPGLTRPDGQPQLQLAMRPVHDGDAKIMLPARVKMEMLKADVPAIAPADQSLPPPTAVDLQLELTNDSPNALDLRVVQLSLEITGDGVVRKRAAGALAPPFLQRQPLHLLPGKPYIWRIDRLIAGRPDRLEYIYLTRPGECTISARLRLTSGAATFTVKCKPIHVTIGEVK